MLTNNGTKAVVMTLSARLVNMQTNAEIEVNVFLDTCSNVTLLTQDAADRLNLTGVEAKVSLTGIGDKKSKIDSSFVDAKLISMDGTSTTELKGIQVIPVITNDVTALDWTSQLKKHNIKGYPPVNDGRIDLLIGMDHAELNLHRQFIQRDYEPLFIKTALGWSGCGVLTREEIASMQNFFLKFSDLHYPNVVPNEGDEAQADIFQIEDDGERSGELDLRNDSVTFLSFLTESNREEARETKSDIKKLIDLIERSYKYDNFPETGNSVEDEYCMRMLQDTFEIRDGKAFISPLWREGQPSGFNTNYPYCLNRLNSILKTMSDADFECIDNIFNDYLVKGLVEEVTDQIEYPYDEHAIWWPHFPVKQPKSETTPVRPVNDGRAKCINGKSINDHCFHAGPSLMCDLVQVLLRSRLYDVMISADISKMFYCVNVPEDMKKYQRYMWVQKDDRKKLRYFQYKGHLLGKVCSPTCCIFATQKNATSHEAEFPRAAEAIKESTVVDDTLDSVPTSEEAIKLVNDLITVNGKIGLKMVKISTNDLAVAKGLPDSVSKSKNMLLYEMFGPQGPEYAPGTIPKCPQIRTLGQYLNLIEDVYTYSSYEPDDNIVWTKTRCLSQAHKIYDPLGAAIPVLLESKLFMQDLWRRKAEWTDTLTDIELERWKDWLINLPFRAVKDHMFFDLDQRSRSLQIRSRSLLQR